MINTQLGGFRDGEKNRGNASSGTVLSMNGGAKRNGDKGREIFILLNDQRFQGRLHWERWRQGEIARYSRKHGRGGDINKR